MGGLDQEQMDFWGSENPTIPDEFYDDYIEDTLSFNYYQQQIRPLILTHGQDRLMENTLGLVGEAGEVAEKVKKNVRDGFIDVDDLMKELGDVLFYIAALADFFDRDLGPIANDNLDKLYDRKKRGKLQGNGDNR